ncbi:hypothetical protein [Nocardia shimofusensis]|nr:hypothetical protein [Nocardia shimofusensis]
MTDQVQPPIIWSARDRPGPAQSTEVLDYSHLPPPGRVERDRKRM